MVLSISALHSPSFLNRTSFYSSTGLETFFQHLCYQLDFCCPVIKKLLKIKYKIIKYSFHPSPYPFTSLHLPLYIIYLIYHSYSFYSLYVHNADFRVEVILQMFISSNVKNKLDQLGVLSCQSSKVRIITIHAGNQRFGEL